MIPVPPNAAAVVSFVYLEMMYGSTAISVNAADPITHVEFRILLRYLCVSFPGLIPGVNYLDP